MKNFRVQVWHQQQLLGHFDITETRGADSAGLAALLCRQRQTA